MKKLLAVVLALSLLWSSSATAGLSSPPQRILEDGVLLPFNTFIDFKGSGVACVFNGATGRNECSVAASVAGEANSLAADGTDCAVGSAARGVDAVGNGTGCFAVQPLDAKLTALAALVCVNGFLQYTGSTLVCGTSTAVTTGTKGDINVIGADTDWVLINDAVTNAKLNNMAVSTIKGRATAGTGDPEDLTASQVRTILNVADGANNYAHPNHSGDVTSVSDGATTIAADAVTNAKLANMATATIKGRTTAGTGDPEDLSVAQTAAVLDASIATQAELDTHTNATTAHSATATPTASRIVLGNGSGKIDAGWLPLPSASTLGGVLTGSNCNGTTGKMIGVGTDGLPVCGTDQNTGGGGGSAQGIQANADIDRVITNAVDFASAFCAGGTTARTCLYGNDTEGAVWTVTPAQDFTWKLAGNFKLNIKDSASALIAEFDEATKAVTIPNTLVVSGLLVAPGVVKQFESASAPTVNDDTTAGFAPHSEWIETGPNPDKVWTCVDATLGAAVWQLGGGGGVTQVDKSLQDAFNVGKTITNANSEANAFDIGDGTGGKKFWRDAGTGWNEKVYPDSNYTVNIPDTFAQIWKYNGTEAMSLTSTSLTFANAHKPVIPIPWSAGGVETDGTNCATQAQSTVNSGTRVQDFGCVAFATAAGTFYQIFEMRGAWSHTDTMTFTLRVRTIGTTTKDWKADVALWCLSDGDAYPSDTNFDSATPQEISIATGATANVRKSATTVAITAGGTCAANDSVVARVKTKSGHNATAAEAKVIGGFLAPKYLKLGD